MEVINAAATQMTAKAFRIKLTATKTNTLLSPKVRGFATQDRKRGGAHRSAQGLVIAPADK